MLLLIAGHLLCCPDLKGAFEKKEVGASSFAIGNAAVAIDDYLFAIYYNPAALSSSKNYQAAFTYQNFFGLRDLSSIDVTTQFSMADHPFSIALNQFGNPIYQELQFSAGSRIEIVEECKIGFSIQCYILSIKGYGQKVAFGTNIGLFYKMLPEVTVGALITNLNRPMISEDREYLPRTMSLGFSYFPEKNLTIYFEVLQDLRYSSEIRAGIAYQIIPFLTLRAGVEDHLSLYCYGLGLKMSWFNIDYSLRIHSVLGLSHIATFSVKL